MDESGTHFISKLPTAYMPFGLGRRSCIGENFAKGEIFVMFCWLFSNYSFSKVPGKEQESLFKFEIVSSFANELAPYEIILRKRWINEGYRKTGSLHPFLQQLVEVQNMK